MASRPFRIPRGQKIRTAFPSRTVIEIVAQRAVEDNVGRGVEHGDFWVGFFGHESSPGHIHSESVATDLVAPYLYSSAEMINVTQVSCCSRTYGDNVVPPVLY